MEGERETIGCFIVFSLQAHKREREREREGERERVRERERERETDRQTDRGTERQRQGDRRHTDRQQIDRQQTETDKQTDRRRSGLCLRDACQQNSNYRHQDSVNRTRTQPQREGGYVAH